MTTWVINYFVPQGKTALPEGAYKLVVHGLEEENVPLQEEVRAAFQDQADYDKFLTGEDYSYGLADVPDDEFVEHYESIVQAMRGLGLDGLMVELPTVPHAFLRDAPLTEGEWIDAYVVALAEWGTRFVQKGYLLGEADDGHPFAWYQVLDSGGLRSIVRYERSCGRRPGSTWLGSLVQARRLGGGSISNGRTTSNGEDGG